MYRVSAAYAVSGFLPNVPCLAWPNPTRVAPRWGYIAKIRHTEVMYLLKLSIIWCFRLFFVSLKTIVVS